MSRIVAAFSLVLLAAAVAFGPSLMSSSPAVAQGSSSGSGTKVCKAKTAEGKTKTWRCQKDQACCVNQMMGTYVCGIPGMGCL